MYPDMAPSNFRMPENPGPIVRKSSFRLPSMVCYSYAATAISRLLRAPAWPVAYKPD